jgi:hypothetical protein
MKKNYFWITQIGLPGKTGPDLGKTEPESGKAESGSSKAELESGKMKSEQGCEIGLQEEAKPTSVERFKEESVMKKDEVEKDGSPLDKGKMKPITEGDSAKGGDTIQTDWRLPLVDVSYVAPQAHGIVNVALHLEYSPGIIFIFSQGRTGLYHV